MLAAASNSTVSIRDFVAHFRMKRHSARLQLVAPANDVVRNSLVYLL